MTRVHATDQWFNPSEMTPHWSWRWSDLESADLVLHVNAVPDVPDGRGRSVVMLYEPSAIIPDAYGKARERSGDFRAVVTHRLDWEGVTNAVVLPPCVPSWVDDHATHPKSRDLSMIASVKRMCRAHELRQRVADSFPFPEHLYGTGRRQQLERKQDGLIPYRFSVAMENDRSPGYYSEKLLDCLLTGAVPVHWGWLPPQVDPRGTVSLDELGGKWDGLDEDRYRAMWPHVLANYWTARSLNLGFQDLVTATVARLR